MCLRIAIFVNSFSSGPWFLLSLVDIRVRRQAFSWVVASTGMILMTSTDVQR